MLYMISANMRERNLGDKIIVFFGMGRTIEVYLIGTKFIMGILTVIPIKNYPEYLATLHQNYPWWVLSAPWFLLSGIQTVAVVLDFFDTVASHVFRIIGAIFGLMFWIWIIFSLLFVDFIGSGLTPFAIMAVFANLFIMFRGFLGMTMPREP